MSIQYATLIEHLPGMLYRCKNDPNWTMEYVSPGCLVLTGYQCRDLQHSHRVAFGELIHAEDTVYVWNAVQTAIRNKTAFEIEYRIHTQDGKIKWVWDQGRAVTDPSGCVTGIDGFITDITQRKQVESGFIQSIQKKDILLTEIHHRIKNNLQVIMSLLKLHLQQEPDKTIQEKYATLKHRIYAMALVYERMYHTGNYTDVNMMDYMKALSHHLCRTYDPYNRIELKFEIHDVRLGMDFAIPCGMILSELIVNSMKYAFDDQQHGRICVEFNHESESHVTIIYRDDGAGLPGGVDPVTAQSLGLSLIRILTKQINGTIQFLNDRGLVCMIVIPVAPL